MATFNICSLHFTAPLHIADSRSSYDVSLKTIQSDTLYAALTSCLAKLGVDIPANGDLGFTISSLFPFYQENSETQAVFFLPKPLIQKLPKLENIGDAKKIKKVAWLDIPYASRWYAGEMLFEQREEIEDIYGEFLSKSAIDSKFISSSVSHRVSVSRTGKEDARPFYMDRVYFKGRSGLYFIYEGDDTLLKKGMELLQYEGIGTDRNVGNGQFECEFGGIDIPLPSGSDYAMALSVFIPEDQAQMSMALSGSKIAYNLMRRGGWITSQPYTMKRKNYVYAFTPASVLFLPLQTTSVLGRIVNLKPQNVDHSIFRSGKSLFIPIKLEDDVRN